MVVAAILSQFAGSQKMSQTNSLLFYFPRISFTKAAMPFHISPSFSWGSTNGVLIMNDFLAKDPDWMLRLGHW